MAHDIFLSYDSADLERVRALVEILENAGWVVWWDRKIPPGRTFADVIYSALSEARCVVVIWSRNSVDSKWVRKEAAEAERRETLVPVLIDDVTVPFEFRDIHAARLPGFPSERRESQLSELRGAIGELLSHYIPKPSSAPPKHHPDESDEPIRSETDRGQDDQPTSKPTKPGRPPEEASLKALDAARGRVPSALGDEDVAPQPTRPDSVPTASPPALGAWRYRLCPLDRRKARASGVWWLLGASVLLAAMLYPNVSMALLWVPLVLVSVPVAVVLCPQHPVLVPPLVALQWSLPAAVVLLVSDQEPVVPGVMAAGAVWGALWALLAFWRRRRLGIGNAWRP